MEEKKGIKKDAQVTITWKILFKGKMKCNVIIDLSRILFPLSLFHFRSFNELALIFYDPYSLLKPEFLFASTSSPSYRDPLRKN